MRFTVLELPLVCPLVDRYVEKFDLTGRIDSFGADMFTQPWPDGHDGIFISNVFHDWDTAKCEALLVKAFDALPPGGRIYIHEQLLDDDFGGPLTPISFSMAMDRSTI